MGLFDWFKQKEEHRIKEKDGWLELSIVLYYGQDNKKEDIEKIAREIIDLLEEAYAVFDRNGKFICIDYKLIGEDENGFIRTSVIPMVKDLNGQRFVTKTLDRKFAPKVESWFERKNRNFYGTGPEDNKGDWKVTITATYHSLKKLKDDLFIVHNVCLDYEKKTGVHHKYGYNNYFIKDEPAIEAVRGLLRIRYKVKDRIKFGEINKELDKGCFGEDIYTAIKKIKGIKRLNREKDYGLERWIKEVEELIKNKNENKRNN